MSTVRFTHHTSQLQLDRKTEVKNGAMVDSFGVNSQTEQKSTVPMPNPVNSEDTNIFATCKLH